LGIKCFLYIKTVIPLKNEKKLVLGSNCELRPGNGRGKPFLWKKYISLLSQANARKENYLNSYIVILSHQPNSIAESATCG